MASMFKIEKASQRDDTVHILMYTVVTKCILTSLDKSEDLVPTAR